MARDLGQRAGQLHAGGTAADHHESQPAGAVLYACCALGELKGLQHAAANLLRIGQRLESRRMRCPFVVAEVAVRGATGHDQVVVFKNGLVVQHDLALRGKHGTHVGHQRRDIAQLA